MPIGLLGGNVLIDAFTADARGSCAHRQQLIWR
jgi:hypothetical protein